MRLPQHQVTCAVYNIHRRNACGNRAGFLHNIQWQIARVEIVADYASFRRAKEQAKIALR